MTFPSALSNMNMAQSIIKDLIILPTPSGGEFLSTFEKKHHKQSPENIVFIDVQCLWLY